MKMHLARLLAFCGWVSSLSVALAETNAASTFVWRDARELCIEGKGWTETKSFYDRLPARAEGVVRSPVWSLSQNSAGLCVRFVSDATKVAARWKLRSATLAMPHMPATGVSGVDLYMKDKSGWHWLGNGRPTQQAEEKTLIQGLPAGKREFALYLPLYNGVEEVKVGVPPESQLVAAARHLPQKKPIVFYGTSILQGGCAARPGMAYPTILGRWLDWPTINLGFSGNAHSEPEIATLLAELDPAVYVLDPLPNMTTEMVVGRLEDLVRTLRRAHPHTPIVLVENARYPVDQFLPSWHERIAKQNQTLREIYERLLRSGEKRLFLLRANRYLGEDGEATVDGIHPTDLGFERIAKAMAPTLRRALKAGR